MHHNVPTKEKRLRFHLGSVHLVLVFEIVLCSAAMCHGATVEEETKEDRDSKDIDSIAFSIKSLEGCAILDGRATKTVSGFMSVQQAVDQYEDTAIEKRKLTAPSVESCPRLSAGANKQEHKRKQRFRMNRPRFIFDKRRQNTRTKTHPRVKTTC